jgi:Concanavalin A-like lectin/glucanases superfamily
MLQLNQLVGFAGKSRYVARAVNFDGTNDYMTRGGGLTGAVDGKVGTCSCWFRLNGGDGNIQYIVVPAGSTGFYLQRYSDNKLYVAGFNVSGTQILNFSSSGTYTASSGWTQVLASWDLASGALQMYVNDATASPTINNNTNDTIDYTISDWGIGGSIIGLNKLNADVAELYVNFAIRIDLSIEANRRKFISIDKRPVNLGQNGELPSGAQPIIYCKGPAASFSTNLGSGGNFTLTGSLADSSTSPSG